VGELTAKKGTITIQLRYPGTFWPVLKPKPDF